MVRQEGEEQPENGLTHQCLRRKRYFLIYPWRAEVETQAVWPPRTDFCEGVRKQANTRWIVIMPPPSSDFQ